MPAPYRLAIVNTHPIQYYSPLYRALAASDDVQGRVFYGWRGEGAYDPGFQQDVSWDVPLLNGYPYSFIENTASDPGTHHFWGIQNPNMVSTITEWGPDVLLVFGWNYKSHLRLLRHFHDRIPILFRGDSTLLDETAGPRKWARRLFLRWVYSHVDVALYVGQNNRAYFEAHGLDDDQLYWVPHAIDNERFYDTDERAAEEAASWRRELGLSSEDRVVLFAGKLEAKKAPDLLLDGFLQMESGCTHLFFAGSGPMEEELRDAADGHPRVHFLGFQNQSRMPVVYRLADLFVLPSRGPGETWGLAVNEAMACGCPVLVTDQVGCARDLVDEENGAVVLADDRVRLHNALNRLLENDGELEEKGAASRERISEWTIEAAADRTLKAVRRVVVSA